MIKFCIFSVDDRRKRYTDAIRSQLGGSFWFQEREVRTVNGNDPEQLRLAQLNHKYKINWRDEPGPKKGHLGIWYSVLNAIDDPCVALPVVTFEDDAILSHRFVQDFWEVTESLPKDTDAFSLFLPRDQDDVYYHNASKLQVGIGVCRAYQRYGGVSMLWTAQGSAKFRRLLQRDGITDQWDNQLYSYARAGEMNVYTQTPGTITLVTISGTEDSIVQESDYAG